MIRQIFASNLVPLALFSYSSYQLFLKPAFNLGQGVVNHFVRQRVNFKERYGENSYALITGATSGIGEEFADQLAKEGFNLILVGRSAEKLKKKQEELENKFPNHRIQTRQLDLSSQNLDDYRNLAKSVESYDIGMVVNNAGVITMCPISQEKPETLYNLVNTNMGPYVYLTHELLPQLQKREKKSAIVYTSSNASRNVRPYMAAYSASKTFNDIFAQRLNEEVKEKIDILSFKPSLVTSNMVQKKPSNISIISAEEAARCALDKLSYDVATTGCWKHIVFINLLGFLGKFMTEEKKYAILRERVKKAVKVN